MSKESLTMIVGSDLHGNLPSLPECDLLVLIGDVFPWQTHNIDYQRSWQEEIFLPWLNHQSAPEKILVAGNHDFLWEKEHPRGNFHYLEDQLITIGGWKIWGTPWTPPRPGSQKSWAFKISETEITKKLSKIDPQTNILLSHGPPWGLLDWTGNRHAGSPALLQAIKKISPEMCLFGHIHESSGPLLYEGKLLLNTTIRDRQRRAGSMWKIDLNPDAIFWSRNTKK